MSKTYTYAGWSFYKDQWKLRYANDAKREKHLVKHGHQSVVFIQLPEPMTERDAARHMFADTNLMQSAPWRRNDSDGEDQPNLANADERMWYVEHWLEEHPEIFYPESVKKAA